MNVLEKKQTKTRELSLGEKQAILKLRKEGKSIRAIVQALGILHTTWKEPEKEINWWLTEKQTTGQPRKITAVDDRNIVKDVKKARKTSVSDITNNVHRTGVKASQSTI